MTAIRRFLLVYVLLVLTTISVAQRQEVHILSVNDMHANLDNMPRLAGVVDSLRTLYPSLLLFSAGDNRTGNPINDLYTPSGYPVVALMNQMGFSASAIGNHEFDNNSLSLLCGLSTFPYICANIHADDSTGIKAIPYHLFDVNGIKVGVIGVIQTNEYGTPDAHPNVLRGMSFESPFDVVGRYEWLRRECDITILLSHVGYYGDIKLAEMNPWIDLIIGGHSHRQLSENEPLHNGVLITQNRNFLGRATHITLVLDSGKVVSKTTDYINIRPSETSSTLVKQMVEVFNSNPYFKRKLTVATSPFTTRNEVGTMVCDALLSETKSDVALINFRGIRVQRMKAGDICVRDALEIDPFGNQAVVTNLRGDQLEKLIIEYGRMNIYQFPHLSGLHADLIINQDDPSEITKVTITDMKGKPIKKRKIYRVVTNSYVAEKAEHLLPNATEVLNITTSDILMSFLQKQPFVNYQGKSNLNYIRAKK